MEIGIKRKGKRADDPEKDDSARYWKVAKRYKRTSKK
jgi:hypothetical protein